MPMVISNFGDGEMIAFRSSLIADAFSIAVASDNLSSYYDLDLKNARLARLTRDPHFRFLRIDLADRERVERLFQTEGFEKVVHLAAQAGIRYSLTKPEAYIDANLAGFANV